MCHGRSDYSRLIDILPLLPSRSALFFPQNLSQGRNEKTKQNSNPVLSHTRGNLIVQLPCWMLGLGNRTGSPDLLKAPLQAKFQGMWIVGISVPIKWVYFSHTCLTFQSIPNLNLILNVIYFLKKMWAMHCVLHWCVCVCDRGRGAGGEVPWEQAWSTHEACFQPCHSVTLRCL